ncbi:hypothetical protein [Streptomyces iakyrus]
MPAPTVQVSQPRIPAPVARPGGDRHPGRARGEPWALAAVLFAAYTVVSVGRYRHLATLSWDLGIFEQVVRSYARLRAPVADLKGPGFDMYIALENIDGRYRDPVGYARTLHPLAAYAVAGEAAGYVVLERRSATAGV